ncbi:OsmC family protein [Nakamurella aerolata]|uniref:OsmC family protein n=1 Tax=Nakamurella aerolata TaxID=1656892 RepID=A0A849A5M9_9ACTN|nr:OsmC family protein [Nakamurella aerolata]
MTNLPKGPHPEAQSHREVRVRRTGAGRFRATNARGGTIEIGSGHDDDFTPVELLLAAVAGCSGIDVDILTSRRAEPQTFDMVVGAEKIRDEGGNRLQDVTLSFSVTFPEGEAGDAAREVLPDAVRRSHERLCTVSRTVELPTSVTSSIADAADR